MSFNIGDIVVKKSETDKGKIIDKMYSEADTKFLYNSHVF